MKRAMRAMLVLTSLAGGSAAMAGDANPRCEMMDRSREQVDALVARAHEGRLTQGQLRAERRRVEARLAHALQTMPMDLKPGDVGDVSRSSADLNQSVIRSQEYEYFGPVARPEWGWYPEGVPASRGSSLTVEPDGRTRVGPLR